MDFREEAFLAGFDEGLDKVAKSKAGEIGKRIGETAGRAASGAAGWLGRVTGVSGTRAALRQAGQRARAGGVAAKVKEGKPFKASDVKAGRMESLKQYLKGLRGKAGRKEDVSAARRSLARLGVTGAAVGTGGLGLRAALKKRKEED